MSPARTPEEKTIARLKAVEARLKVVVDKAMGQPVSVQNDSAEALSLVRRALQRMQR